LNKHLYILVVFCLFAIGANGQKAYKIQKKQGNSYEAFPNPFDFRPSGWLYDAALTTTTAFQEESNNFFLGDSSFRFSGPIRPGVKLTVGRYQSLKKGHKLVKYIDYNLGYKMLWNSESQKATVISNNETIRSKQNNLAHYLTANFNLNNIVSLSDYTFIQNTLGVNADYRFARNLSGEGANTIQEPDAFVVQIHYKLALGFMIDNNKALIPYIEVPIFNITPSQSTLSQLDYFNQSYQTFIVGARIMLFRLGQKSCPTAKGVSVNKKQKNGY
jgi:hypothetical protein